MRWLILIALSFCLRTVKADPDTLYSAEAVKADLNLLADALREAHPGLLRYNTKISFDAYVADLVSGIEGPTPESYVYGQAAALVAGIRDGHTSAMPSVRSQFEMPLLPLHVRVVENKVYVKRDLSADQDIPVGTEIQTVNGVSPAKVIPVIYSFVSGDGFHTTSAPYELEDGGFAHWVAFMQKPQSSYIIEYEDSLGTMVTDTLAATLPKTLHERLRERHPQLLLPQKALKLEILPEQSTAVLSIHSFHPHHIKAGKQSFSRFLRTSFRRIRKAGTQNLVIDLQQNRGGETIWAAKLYSYLSQKPFKWYDQLELKKLERFSFFEHTNLPKRFRNSARDHVESGKGTFYRTRHRSLDMQKAGRKPFTGDVYVLISGRTFSAASAFCARVQADERGTFIGETTGGAYKNFSAGGTPILTLPNTGVRVQIPLVNVSVSVPDPEKPGFGIAADIEVPRQNGGIEGNPALAKALQIIREKS